MRGTRSHLVLYIPIQQKLANSKRTDYSMELICLFSLSVWLPVCLSLCLAHLSVPVSVCMAVCLSMCLARLSVHVFVCLYFCLSVPVSCLSVWCCVLPVCLTLCLPISWLFHLPTMSVCQSVCLPASQLPVCRCVHLPVHPSLWVYTITITTGAAKTISIDSFPFAKNTHTADSNKDQLSYLQYHGHHSHQTIQGACYCPLQMQQQKNSSHIQPEISQQLHLWLPMQLHEIIRLPLEADKDGDSGLTERG